MFHVDYELINLILVKALSKTMIMASTVANVRKMIKISLLDSNFGNIAGLPPQSYFFLQIKSTDPW